MIKLLVGLGNPGAEYERTRHNAGFWWVDEVARQAGAQLVAEKAFYGLLAKTSVHGHMVWLLKPTTFMNRSGQAVAALARFYKIEPEEILVVHDELDLLPGHTKLKLGGSHAGHNGLKDIQAQLGSSQFWRLRLGVGHPGVRSEVIHWVLQKPSPDDRISVDQGIDRTLKALPDILDGRMEEAMRTIHVKPSMP